MNSILHKLQKKLGQSYATSDVSQSSVSSKTATILGREPTAPPATTFTMKKPFTFKSGSFFGTLAEAFSQCNTDEEKVQLLSVLNRRHSGGAFSNVDFDDSCSSSSSNSGDSTYLPSESDSEAELLPGRGSEAPQPECSSRIGAQQLSSDCQCKNPPPPDVTPCDPETKSAPPTAPRQQITTGEQTSEGVKNASEKPQEKTEDEHDKLEWTFTLYDFDGSGKVTKEDIVSLVRSIYEVLGNAKIPLNKNERRKTKKSHSGSRSNFVEPLQAFKVRLTLMATQNGAQVLEPQEREVKFAAEPEFIAETSCTKSKFAAKRKSISRLPGRKTSPEAPHGGERRQHLTGHYANLQELHLQKRPRKLSSSQQPCSSCTYRDYVNLSELENCCGLHRESSVPGVHHIRHCDRHCTCSRPGAQPPSRYPELTGCNAERRDILLSPNSCDYARIPPQTRAEVSCHAEEHEFGHVLQSLNSRARNQAYYNAHRTVAAAARQKFEAVLEDPNGPTGQQDPYSPPSTHFFADSPNLHQRKHKNRHKEKQRALKQVHDWILKEGAAAEEEKKAPDTVEADPKKSAVIIQHKHVHEHHHYIHNP